MMRSRMAARDILCNDEIVNACKPKPSRKSEAEEEEEGEKKEGEKKDGTGRRRRETDMRSDHTVGRDA
jgi:hypothetical protein